MVGECTAVGCYLEQHGGLVSFPLVTIAGLVDGINPCAIGMLVLLLGYLLVFAKKPERIFKTGILYIGTVYLTYLVVGYFLFSSLNIFQLSSYRAVFNPILGGVLLLAGLVNIKDFWFVQEKNRQGIWGKIKSFHLEIPQKARPGLLKIVEQVSYPATIILAVLVTLFETPCSLPIYVGTLNILSQAGLPFLGILGYFLYYNFLFVLPLIIIFCLVWQGGKIVELKEWEHKYRRWMKLSIGIILTVIAGWTILW